MMLSLVLGQVGQTPAPTAPSQSRPPQYKYKLTDLGTLGGEESHAAAIRGGVVVGSSKSATGHRHAFRWVGGTMLDLGTLGGTESVARATDEHGEVVGFAKDSANRWRAFIYRDGEGMLDLGALVGLESQALGVSSNGQNLVGVSLVRGGARAFLYEWQTQSLADLSLGAFPFVNRAVAVNNHGQVAGDWFSPSRGVQAAIYEGGTIRWLGDLGAYGSSVAAINKQGDVAGSAYVGARLYKHACLWRSGRSIADIGTLGGLGSAALALDNQEPPYVVGSSLTEPGPNGVDHAFLYREGEGMLDLNTCLVNRGDWTIREATGIDQKGRIVANAYREDRYSHAVLLTPIRP